MDTPFEESNLAGIGSDEDKACREAAAKIEMHWEGAGESEGIQIWRVENRRSEDDVPIFGIVDWPKKKYGQFHRGDSYVMLQTQKDDEGVLFWDIFFWIGSQSSQDEYGVAAYKANELDDLLGDAPVQHREVETRESEEFMSLFTNGIQYLEGGFASGFRKVGADANEEQLDEAVPDRLFCVRRGKGVTRCFEVPLACSSLNNGDAFLLDTGDKIFTWFGTSVSPFEKNKSASMAQNIADSRNGHAQKFIDVGDDNEEFWSLLGGKCDIPDAVDEDAAPIQVDPTMYIISDEGGQVKFTKTEVDKSNLDTNNVCLIDTGDACVIWTGKGASKVEKQQSMRIVSSQLKNTGRSGSTTIYKIMEGQEKRCCVFKSLF